MWIGRWANRAILLGWRRSVNTFVAIHISISCKAHTADRTWKTKGERTNDELNLWIKWKVVWKVKKSTYGRSPLCINIWRSSELELLSFFEHTQHLFGSRLCWRMCTVNSRLLSSIVEQTGQHRLSSISLHTRTGKEDENFNL